MKNTTAKHRRTKKFTRRFIDTKSIIVTFVNRSWENLLQAIDNLKSKYKRVVLKTQVALGGGLWAGSIELS